MLYVTGTETSGLMLLFVTFVESLFDSVDYNDSSLLEHKFTISDIVFDLLLKNGCILSNTDLFCIE